MLFRKVIPLLLVLCVICFPASAEELTQAKRGDIEHLLTMTGAMSIGKQMAAGFITNLTQSLKKARPDIPENALKVLPAEVMATVDENIDSLKEEIILIYHKHFTAAEIKEMIHFYSTEVGQKTIKVLPAIVQEGMVVGQRWGESLSPQLIQRITAKLKQQGVNI